MNEHERQCTVCRYIADPNNPEIVWTGNNTEVARSIGCSRDAVGRHLRYMKAHGFVQEPRTRTVVKSAHEAVPGTWIPRRRWQTPNGEELASYQFVPEDGEAATHVDDARIDRILRAIPDPRPKRQPSGNSGTEILVIADPQLGKAGEAGGGTAETIERILRAVDTAIETRYAHNPPKELYLVDGGDLVENLMSTPQQAATNDRTLPEQIEDAIATYLTVIGKLLNHTERLVHVTVTSNHGEARSTMKVNPYGSENDWGLAIQRMIRERCADRGWPVDFVRPDLNEDTSVFTTYEGTTVAVNHGHHSGTPARVKAWVTGQIVGKRPGHNADMWIMNHYHHRYINVVGDGVTLFGTPSIDPGSAWFTRKTGECDPPGLMALTVNDGDWSNYSVVR